MADRETRVRYKALADFSALARSVRNAKRAVKELREEEAKLNAQSVAGQGKTTKAADATTSSRRRLKRAVDDEAGSVQKSTGRFLENSKALRENASSADAAGRSQQSLLATTERWIRGADGVRRVVERNGRALEQQGRHARRNTTEMGRFARSMDQSRGGAERLYRGLQRLGNWRPRLTPPFVALIPIIGGVLALINPLVSGFGALAIAAFALGSSLASGLGGALVGIIPGLVTLLGLVAALKTAFGGIGNAFKAFSAMKDAAGGGGGGSAKQELTDTEKLARAQQRYADATQDVLFAQEDLDDARKGYLKRLRDLQKAVDRIALSEARAAANSQLARENYANVLADPGSTKGQKMDAQVSVKEAQDEYNDLIERNIELVSELAEMQKKGMEGDREVIQAQRQLTAAINAQRDAQLELANEASGANKAMAGGASAASEYQRMLAKLSPSARRFVEFIVGMSESWDALRRNVQESFFSEVVDDLDRIPRLLRPVERMLSAIAGAAGRVFSKFIQLVTGAEWLSDIEEFGNRAAPIIEIVGDGVLSLLDAFRNLAMAAMPFLKAMSEGFRDGAEQFATMVEEGRRSGSIAAWLEKARLKLAQWWRIIKNIGMTLFNYSAAAEDFGGWILDGLEGITEGWRDASEEARREGSPFQQYLENIKPLLSEVQKLFADFFSWFSREASDPENIQMFTDIIHTLREDVGPAIARILDALSESGVGPGIVEAIAAIVNLIATVAENGGADAMRTFFDVLNFFFGVLSNVARVPGVSAFLGALAAGLATISALTFVGKFTGLTSLLGMLLKATKGGAVARLLDKLSLTLGGPGVKGGIGTLLKGTGLFALLALLTQSAAGSLGTASEAIPDLANFKPQGSTREEKKDSVIDRSSMWAGELMKSNPAAIIASTITDLFGGDGEAVTEWFRKFGEDAARAQTEFFAGMQEKAIVFFGRTLPDAWNGAIAWIRNTWNGFMGWVRGLWTGVFVWVRGLWLGAINWVRGLWEGAVAWVRGLWTGAVEWVKGLWTGAVEWVKGLFAWAGGIGETIATNVRNAINAIIRFINSLPLPFGDIALLPGDAKATGTGGKHNGGPIRRAGGGGVPGRGNSDTVAAMLTPGEFVIRKAIVERVGAENLARLNAGLLSYAELLQQAMKEQRGGPEKPKQGGGFTFNGGGIVPGLPPGFGGSGSNPPPGHFGNTPGGGGTSMNFGDVNVYYPKPERASDSLPRTIRSLAYLGGKR